MSIDWAVDPPGLGKRRAGLLPRRGVRLFVSILPGQSETRSGPVRCREYMQRIFPLRRSTNIKASRSRLPTFKPRDSAARRLLDEGGNLLNFLGRCADRSTYCVRFRKVWNEVSRLRDVPVATALCHADIMYIITEEMYRNYIHKLIEFQLYPHWDVW